MTVGRDFVRLDAQPSIGEAHSARPLARTAHSTHRDRLVRGIVITSTESIVVSPIGAERPLALHLRRRTIETDGGRHHDGKHRHRHGNQDPVRPGWEGP